MSTQTPKRGDSKRDELIAGEYVLGILSPDDRRKVVYALTKKGEALLPVVLALRQWGEDWGHGCQQIVLDGGDHSFTHFPELLPQLFEFCGL